MKRTELEWISEYKKKDALWIHDDNPKRPHALLTSGMHSNGFFNSRLVIPDEELLRNAVEDLIEKFYSDVQDLRKIKLIVGPQTGATKLAEFIKDRVEYLTGRECFFASPAKNEVDGVKSMIFNEKEERLLYDYWTLLCEDVVTTGSSIKLTQTAISNAGGYALPYLLTLVNRSGLKEIGGKKIFALIDKKMPIWNPAEGCPLCEVGSEALRPKENWALLNATY